MFHWSSFTPPVRWLVLALFPFATAFTPGTSSAEPAVDRQPALMAFIPRHGAPPATFVVSGHDVIAGINAPIDVSIENGCYFVFAGIRELPRGQMERASALAQAECITERRTLQGGEIVVLGHVSAAEPATTTITTFHYGSLSAEFRSTTAIAMPPSRGTAAATVDASAGGGALLWLLPLLPLFRRDESGTARSRSRRPRAIVPVPCVCTDAPE